jgi:hypothetical protein
LIHAEGLSAALSETANLSVSQPEHQKNGKTFADFARKLACMTDALIGDSE